MCFCFFCKLSLMAKNLQEFVVGKVCEHLDRQNCEIKKLKAKLELLEFQIQKAGFNEDNCKCFVSGCDAEYISHDLHDDIYIRCTKMIMCKKCNEHFCDMHYDEHIEVCVCMHHWQICCACISEEEDY